MKTNSIAGHLIARSTLLTTTVWLAAAGFAGAVDQTIISVSGDRFFGFNFDRHATVAASWSQTVPYENVAISADVSGAFETGQIATAFLTTRVGQRTGRPHEIARAEFLLSDGPVRLFEHLDLPAGTYFLTLSCKERFPASGTWWVSQNPELVSGPGVSLGGVYLAHDFVGNDPYPVVHQTRGYPPGSDFSTFPDLAYTLNFSVVSEAWEDGVSEDGKQ